jgi:kumamolisin
MTNENQRVPLAGSERAALPGSKVIASANPDEVIQVSLRLRARTAINSSEVQKRGAQAASERQHLTHEEYEQRHGANPDDISKIEQFAHENRLAVVEASAARRTVVLSGTVATFCSAFEVELKQYEHEGMRFRGRVGAVHIPQELDGVITGVFGLDNRPQAKPHFRRKRTPMTGAHAQAASVSYTPLQVAQAYNFPTGFNGSGQTIALIELGGGYRPRDLSSYFKSLNIKQPKIAAVSVDGGHNTATGDPNGPDGEVMLDIEVAGAVAPAASVVVYFAPNTDAGFLDAITSAVHDTKNKPSVVSISWGGPEGSFTQQSLTAFDEAFQAAASLGVTVMAAAGDNGSTDGVSDGQQHCDFPASDPFVLACGGTSLRVTGNTAVETVWNELALGGGATGGGISDVFPLPDYQKNASIPPSVNDKQVRRGVPDVSGDADPETGYQIFVDGQKSVIGGTSAVAPLMAGLVARLNQQAGQPIGFLNPVLYQQAEAAGAFHDVTQGNNGSYSAGAGWDACTGLGSPDGTKLAGVLIPKQAAQRTTVAGGKMAAAS